MTTFKHNDIEFDGEFIHQLLKTKKIILERQHTLKIKDDTTIIGIPGFSFEVKLKVNEAIFNYFKEWFNNINYKNKCKFKDLNITNFDNNIGIDNIECVNSHVRIIEYPRLSWDNNFEEQYFTIGYNVHLAKLTVKLGFGWTINKNNLFY